MSEIERLVKNSVITADFLNPETRDDFYIDENRKKIWALSIDLYLEFERVCSKHGLSFFTDGGTTLGAIRHGGFIPWDDDIDVCMPRESYEKLKFFANEFQAPYFLQSTETEPNFGYSIMRLRNSNTLSDAGNFSDCDFNQGVALDILPLDKVTKDDYLWRRQRISELIKRNSARMRLSKTNKTQRDYDLINQNLNKDMSSRDVWDELNKIATIDEREQTDYISIIVTSMYPPENKIWPIHIFDNYELKKFENIEVRVPAGWDEQLKIYFGDYMKFPPKEERGNWHKIDIKNPDVPYKSQKQMGGGNFEVQAVILAAGMGKRLGSITKDIPKCLVPVKGKPLLFNSLDILSKTKRIKDVFIVVGYKADLVQKTIGDEYEGMRIHYVYNELYSTTNNVYSLAKVKNLITSDCLLLECDLYYTQSLIDNIIDKTDDCDIVVSKFNPQTMNGTVILSDSDNNAKQLVIKKHQGEGFDYSSAWKTVNIYKFKQLFFNNRLIPAIWEYVRSGNLQNYYELVLGSLIYYRDNNIKIVPVDEKSWYEIDDKNDLKIANNA